MPLLLVSLLLCGSLDSDPQFREGQRQIEEFEFEKASTLFEAIAARPGLDPGDRAQALVWLGIAFAEMRDEARASLAFEEAVTGDPLIVLPRDTSPKIKILLDEARGRVRVRPKPKTDTTAPPPTTTTSTTPPAATTTPTAESETSLLFPAAVGAVAVGGAVGVVGGVFWGLGVSLAQQAKDAPFQDDAAAFADQSRTNQIAGQVGVGVGVATVVIGGALLTFSLLE